MKKLRILALIWTLMLVVPDSYAIRVTKTVLETILQPVNKLSKAPCYADSCEHIIGIPYVENGNERQVMDVYYARENRKNAVLIEIHGGFYVAGKRQNHRPFASVFLKEGYDVVLVEYRLVDGKTLDVSDELQDCAAAVDYVTTHAEELGLNKDCMFITGSSAGSHLALYIAEGSEDKTLPIHPEFFRTRGVMLNCPAYDFATFADPEYFYPSAMAWFLGPRYTDQEWMVSMSPRTYIRSYTGPLFVSTSEKDFLQLQSFLIAVDCATLPRQMSFVFIETKDKKVGHVHNVSHPEYPESKEVNDAMLEFMRENENNQ